MNSASLCSLAGRYDNHIPTWFLAPIKDCLKIPALYLLYLNAEPIFVNLLTLIRMTKDEKVLAIFKGLLL
jgi:hypothetical protein